MRRDEGDEPVLNAMYERRIGELKSID